MARKKRTPAKQEQSTSVVLTVPEAGAQLGLSLQSAYAAAKRGEIPTIKIGGLLRVPRVRFEKLLAGE
jgi:excisionase family DNA binding protein